MVMWTQSRGDSGSRLLRVVWPNSVEFPCSDPGKKIGMNETTEIKQLIKLRQDIKGTYAQISCSNRVFFFIPQHIHMYQLRCHETCINPLRFHISYWRPLWHLFAILFFYRPSFSLFFIQDIFIWFPSPQPELLEFISPSLKEHSNEHFSLRQKPNYNFLLTN